MAGEEDEIRTVDNVESTTDEQSNNKDDSENIVEERLNEEETDYSLFIKAVREGDQRTMEAFIDRHPEALTARKFGRDGTALHHTLADPAKANMAMWLVDRMTAADLEIKDQSGQTPLGRAAGIDHPGVLPVLKLMVEKNPRLPNIARDRYSGIPLFSALEEGHKDIARFLYGVTDENVLRSKAGGRLLNLCINRKTFDIALDLVKRFPDILLQEAFDWETLPKAFTEFSSKSEQQQSGYKQISGKYNDDEKLTKDQARDFLKLVFKKVSTYKDTESIKRVYPAMIYAAKHEHIEFINVIIRANPALLFARSYGMSMFWYAVKNRHEKIFNLIYGTTAEQKDALLGLSYPCYNILHLAATLPSAAVLDRMSSSPALQMQRELLWFKEVWNLADPRYREERNEEGLTPRQLFSQSHEKLIAAGEKLMKETATSSTVVGALILTIMFAAAFTVPGGNNQVTGYPIFSDKLLFKLFIMCDVMSLSSSATSILIFLTILANSHGDEDFLFDLPRRLMAGELSLFFSIANMMVTFCLALALMLHGDIRFILPIALISSVPVVVFSSSMFRLLSKIFVSTFRSSIFDRNTKLPTPYEKEIGEITMGDEMV